MVWDSFALRRLFPSYGLPLSQNARVKSFPIGGGEIPRLSPLDLGPSTAATNFIIAQAYRQFFFQTFKADLYPLLESCLRTNKIIARDWIGSLLLSQRFREDFNRCNSNYRMVDQIVGRVLGRCPFMAIRNALTI